MKSAQRTIQIVVIFVWDVVQPVPYTCKLYRQIIYMVATAGEFYFRSLSLLIFYDVTEELTLVQSVLRLTFPISQSEEPTANFVITPSRMISSIMKFLAVINQTWKYKDFASICDHSVYDSYNGITALVLQRIQKPGFGCDIWYSCREISSSR
jgi:hypothetical protein